MVKEKDQMKHVEIVQDGPNRSFKVDGEDILKAVGGYTIAYDAPSPLPTITVRLIASHEWAGAADLRIVNPEFDALGEMIALIGELDAGEVEKLALNTMEWDSGEPHCTTAAILATIKKLLEDGRT
jgi:hypothetical protein